MAIPSQQIGWSQKAKLLWNISKQLENLIKVAGNVQLTTTSTTTVVPTTTTTTTEIPLTTTTTTTIETLYYRVQLYETCGGPLIISPYVTSYGVPAVVGKWYTIPGAFIYVLETANVTDGGDYTTYFEATPRDTCQA